MSVWGKVVAVRARVDVMSVRVFAGARVAARDVSGVRDRTLTRGWGVVRDAVLIVRG